MEAPERFDESAYPQGLEGRDLQGVYRYYDLAKRADWDARVLPWGELRRPGRHRLAEKQARRHDLWRSVVTQQLQADMIAVEMAAQLFW